VFPRGAPPVRGGTIHQREQLAGYAHPDVDGACASRGSPIAEAVPSTDPGRERNGYRGGRQRQPPAKPGATIRRCPWAIEIRSIGQPTLNGLRFSWRWRSVGRVSGDHQLPSSPGASPLGNRLALRQQLVPEPPVDRVERERCCDLLITEFQEPQECATELGVPSVGPGERRLIRAADVSTNVPSILDRSAR
jgi:hypothetical protein